MDRKGLTMKPPRQARAVVHVEKWNHALGIQAPNLLFKKWIQIRVGLHHAFARTVEALPDRHADAMLKRKEALWPGKMFWPQVNVHKDPLADETAHHFPFCTAGLRSGRVGVIFESCPAPGFDRCVVKEDKVLSHSVEAAQEGAAPGAARTQAPAELTSKALLARILSSLDRDKAEDVVEIDLRGKTQIADYMVVCSGRSTRQVSAIAQNLVDRLKQDLGKLTKVEGQDQGDWVLIDAGDVIVHIFRPEVRAFYQLEKMWQSGGPGTGN